MDQLRYSINSQSSRLKGAAVFLTAASSFSSSVLAAEAAVTAEAYGSHRVLMRDDRSDEPDIANIIDGTPVGGPLSYQLGLGQGGPEALPNCGGSLIASRVVLTAAHCTFLPLDTPVDKVLINAYNLSVLDESIPKGGGIVQASSYVVHPDYIYNPDPNNFPLPAPNDIALFFLPFPVGEDDHFKYATLNEDPNVPADNETLFVSGWGITESGSQSPILLGTNVDYITNEQCAEYVPLGGPTITDGMMCAFRVGTGPYASDSGGPLVISNGTAPAIQVGIVSWGNPVCPESFPTVYTRVSDYVDWIRDTACKVVGELCPSSSESGKSKCSKNGLP